MRALGDAVIDTNTSTVQSRAVEFLASLRCVADFQEVDEGEASRIARFCVVHDVDSLNHTERREDFQQLLLIGGGIQSENSDDSRFVRIFTGSVVASAAVVAAAS